MGRFRRREPICKYCYNEGHTKRTCPNLSESMKTYYKEQAKNRMCKYCSLVGHNRASCTKRKADLAKYKKDMLLQRQAIDRFYREKGIAVGAVLSYKVNEWNKSYYKIQTDVDTIVLMGIHNVRRSDPIFNFYSSAFGRNTVMSVSSERNEWGSTNVEYLDSAGNKVVHSFYTDTVVEVLIPATDCSKLFPDDALYDESTVSVPDNLADTVRKKKEVDDE